MEDSIHVRKAQITGMKNFIRDFPKLNYSGLPFCHTAKEYSPHIVSFLLAEMRRLGVTTQQALAGSGTDPQSLVQGDCRVSVVQILQVVQNGLGLAPTLALDVGQRLGVVGCGIYGYALISSPDRRDLVAFIEKFAHFIDPLTKVAYQSRQDKSVWTFEPYFSDDPTHPLYQFAIELKLASSLRVGKDLFGEGFGLERVRLRYDKSAEMTMYLARLNCAIEFNQPCNELIYARPEMSRGGMSKPDVITNKLMLELCEQEARRVRRTLTLAEEVTRLLQAHADHLLKIEEVADKLIMNAWTLRRRLRAEGTTFSKIATEWRMSLAVRYLSQDQLSIEEIGAKLGYSDASSFSKAFCAWYGASPNKFRQSHKGGGAAPAVPG
jgi:AraC-like DNA-binding protein